MTQPTPSSGAADLPEALRPVEPGALIASIQELNAWESRADGELLTQAEGESIILVLHELKRLIALAAGQAVAQPVRTWCGGCSPENCGGCHIPSNAAAPAQAPSQPGGFDAGDMASAAAQGYRDGWTAAQADSVLDAVRLTSEQEYAIRQGHEIAASDGYFDARPQIESKDRRKVFQAGFERGWDAARKQGANHD